MGEGTVAIGSHSLAVLDASNGSAVPRQNSLQGTARPERFFAYSLAFPFDARELPQHVTTTEGYRKAPMLHSSSSKWPREPRSLFSSASHCALLRRSEEHTSELQSLR